MIVKQGMSLVAVGLALGFVAALPVGRVVSGMLFGVGGNDPVSIAGAALVLVTIALVACYLPARRATRVDPIVALRQA
jgi:putative ABC transport system permease protein